MKGCAISKNPAIRQVLDPLVRSLNAVEVVSRRCKQTEPEKDFAKTNLQGEQADQYVSDDAVAKQYLQSVRSLRARGTHQQRGSGDGPNVTHTRLPLPAPVVPSFDPNKSPYRLIGTGFSSGGGTRRGAVFYGKSTPFPSRWCKIGCSAGRSAVDHRSMAQAERIHQGRHDRNGPGRVES